LSNRSTGPTVAAALGAGFLAVLSLVFPWFEILGKKRSSIDLISSASALDVIEGGLKVLVIAGWLLAPILVASAMLLGAAGRHVFSAILLLPIGVLLLAVFVLGVVVDEIGIAWGAIFGGVFAALATFFAMMVLVMSRKSAPDSAEMPSEVVA